ncbi:MAG: L,D-transpeptidase family protein [Novosphingobium sp.]
MRLAHLTLPLLLLGGCTFHSSDDTKDQASASSDAAVNAPAAREALAAHDPATGAVVAQDIPDSAARPVMQAQVVLDRLGFTPGVVDGKEGLSTRNAVSGFQEANGLTATGQLDEATLKALSQWNNIPATRVVTIPDEFAAGPFYAVPKDPADQAKLPALTYETLDEKLAERFHTTIATLQGLNPGGMPAGMKPVPGATASAPPEAIPSASASPITGPVPGPASIFHAGQQIRVPNIGGDAIVAGAVADAVWLNTLETLGVGTGQPKAAKIVVSKSKGTLKAYDQGGKLVAVYTATMGSTHDPLPLGEWKIQGISHNPPFHYNPALFWNAKPGSEKALLPAGPNGPVGVVWIDLSKPHYGIHGTPHPETIGRAESHGCVRLTNWDVARLAQMVSTKTQVLFEG